VINAIELANFKAFGERTRIEFAPITLIYGQNSAGKSSVLNALNLLKQTRRNREHGALLLPRVERGFVDLGSFHELLHDHDHTRALVIRVDVAPGERPTSRSPRRPMGPLGFEMAFRRETDGADIALDSLSAHVPGIEQAIVRFVPQVLSSTEQDQSQLFSLRSLVGRSRATGWGTPSGAVCNEVTLDESFWRPNYNATFRKKSDVVRALTRAKAAAERTDVKLPERTFSGRHRTDALDEACEFYASDFSLSDYAERQRSAWLGTKVALEGFMPVAFIHGHGQNDVPEAMVVASESRRDPELRSLFPNAIDYVLSAGRQLETALGALFPLGPYRRHPERLYIFTGTTPPDVGYAGSQLPDLLFRRPDLIDETNAWLDRLDIGYHLEVSSVGSAANDIFELRLSDTRRPGAVSVALPDVGFGISQVLPFVVQALAAEQQTITIEQPEVHVHPGLQTDLADLLIAGIQKPKQNQFLIETHSEHLVLRLLRRIRETASGELEPGALPLTPAELSVVYLDRGPTGTVVHHLRVDEDGEFIDRWPRGFFRERETELF
jgi:hypothetical protein